MMGGGPTSERSAPSSAPNAPSRRSKASA